MTADVALAGMWPRQSSSASRPSAGVGVVKYDYVGEFFHVPQGSLRTNYMGDLNLGSVAFEFEAYRDSAISIQAEVRTPDMSSQSYYFQMDNTAAVVWNFGGPHLQWRWVPLRDRSFQLTAGIHTMRFCFREDGAQIRAVRLVGGDATFRSWPDSNMSALVVPQAVLTSPHTVDLTWDIIGTSSLDHEYHVTVAVNSQTDAQITVVVYGQLGVTGRHPINVLCPTGQCSTSFRDRNVGHILKAR